MTDRTAPWSLGTFQTVVADSILPRDPHAFVCRLSLAFRSLRRVQYVQTQHT